MPFGPYGARADDMAIASKPIEQTRIARDQMKILAEAAKQLKIGDP